MPDLYGLVLAGGKSTRMGRDKAHLVYHTQPQVFHQAKLLAAFCDKVYLSVASPQPSYGKYPQLTDAFDMASPLNGIKTAFLAHPSNAWLVVACDMPSVKDNCLAFLVQNRNPDKAATCFWNEARQHPEPLCTIWEPRAGVLLQTYTSKSPLRFLQQHDIASVLPPQPDCLTNINTPTEYTRWKREQQ